MVFLDIKCITYLAFVASSQINFVNRGLSNSSPRSRIMSTQNHLPSSQHGVSITSVVPISWSLISHLRKKKRNKDPPKPLHNPTFFCGIASFLIKPPSHLIRNSSPQITRGEKNWLKQRKRAAEISSSGVLLIRKGRFSPSETNCLACLDKWMSPLLGAKALRRFMAITRCLDIFLILPRR